MNRKEFIQKSAGSLAALSVTNLLLAGNKSKNKRQQEVEENLTFYKETEEVRNGTTYMEEYYFVLPASAKDCSVSEISLEIYQVPKDTDDEYAQQKAIYTIPVKKCKADMGTGLRINTFSCKKMTKVEGPDLALNSPFEAFQKKKATIQLKAKEDGSWSLDVLNKKVLLMSLEEFDPYEAVEDEDCFLTTVCVKHLNKSDDCEELQTLRNFRDSFVRSSENGPELVEMYYEIGPKIVAAIKQSEHKSTILTQMYADLVKPSIELIENNELAAAKQYYVDYTLSLYSTVK